MSSKMYNKNLFQAANMAIFPVLFRSLSNENLICKSNLEDSSPSRILTPMRVKGYDDIQEISKLFILANGFWLNRFQRCYDKTENIDLFKLHEGTVRRILQYL